MKFLLSKEYLNAPHRMYTSLHASAKAEVFSEAYFRGLYRRELRKYLKHMWRYSTEAFEREWPREFARAPGEFDTPEAWEAARREYLLRRHEAMDEWQPEPWDEQAERAEFEADFRREIANLQRELPPDVLSRVADIRVLALNVAAADVKRDIEAICRANRRREEEMIQTLHEHNRRMAELYPGSFIGKMHLHDAEIAGCTYRDGNLVLELSNERRDVEISRVTFEGCEIIHLPDDLPGSEWIYEEVHRDGGGFIFHMLNFHWERPLDRRFDELTLRVQDVKME